MRLEQMQLQLFDALSAYPEYRSVAHNYVTAEELTGLLKPGEGYLKLVRLGDEMFAVFLSPGRSTGWRVEGGAGGVADLVSDLRDSISLSIGGVQATYPFDIDSARALYDALFAPIAGDLVNLEHLVFEPDGALLQLPVNLLTADRTGVAAYHARVDAGARRRRAPAGPTSGWARTSPSAPSPGQRSCAACPPRAIPAARFPPRHGTSRSPTTNWLPRARCSARRAPTC